MSNRNSSFVIFFILLGFLAGFCSTQGIPSEPLLSSSYSRIQGKLWILNATCTGDDQGSLVYQTDLCLPIDGMDSQFFKWFANSSHVIFRTNCTDASCQNDCGDTVFVPNTCGFFGNDHVGLATHLQLVGTESSPQDVLPPLQNEWVKINVSNSCNNGTIYGQRVYKGGCQTISPIGPSFHRFFGKSSNRMWNIIRYTGPNCISDPNTFPSRGHLQCGLGGIKEEFITMIQADERTNLVVPGGKVSEDFSGRLYYDSGCSNSMSIAGKSSITGGQFVFQPADKIWIASFCNETQMFKRACTDSSGLENCIEYDIPFSGCDSIGVDVVGTTIYTSFPSCILEPVVFPQSTVLVGCNTTDISTGPGPFYKHIKSDCVLIGDLSTAEYDVSRVYKCNSTGSFVTTFNNSNICQGEGIEIFAQPLGVCNYGLASPQIAQCVGETPPVDTTPTKSSFSHVHGLLFYSNDSCGSSEMGYLNYETDKCIWSGITDNIYFTWFANATVIIYRECLDSKCDPVGCTDIVYTPNMCVEFDNDWNGTMNYASLFPSNLGFNASFPPLKENWIKIVVSNGSTVNSPEHVVNYGQRVYRSGCWKGNESFSISQRYESYSDFLSEKRRWNYRKFLNSNCSGLHDTIDEKGHLESWFVSVDQWFTISEMGKQNPLDGLTLGNITYEYYYDNICPNNSYGGKGIVRTGAPYQTLEMTQKFFYCNETPNGSVFMQKVCTDRAGKMNCATNVINPPSTCTLSTNDEVLRSIYMKGFECVNTQDDPPNGHLWQQECSSPLHTGVYMRYAEPVCAVLTPGSQPGLSATVARIYDCNSNGTFYSEWNGTTCQGPSITVQTSGLGVCNGVTGLKSDKCYMQSAQSTFTCFGFSSLSPLACSRNGVCVNQDVCECFSSHTGANCGVVGYIPPNSVFNLTSNLNGARLTIGATSSMSITGQNLTMTNTTLSIGGSMTISAGTINLSGTKLSIVGGGRLIIAGNAQVRGDPGSTLESSGTVSITMGTGTTVFLIAILNKGSFEINGAGNINLTNSITQSDTGTFTCLDSNITVDGDMVMSNGFVNLGGNLKSPNVTISDALFRTPKGLYLQGSLTLNSTMIFEINSIASLKTLLVSNSLRLYSTVILKLMDGFNAGVGQELNVIPSASDFLINGSFILLGGPTKTGLKYEVNNVTSVRSRNFDSSPDITSKTMKIVVAYSIGDEKSMCHYIGQGKNFEFNLMDKYASLSFVVPTGDKSVNYAIGWNTNNVLNLQKLVVFTNLTFGPLTVQSNGNFLVDSVVKTIPQIFGVGPPYFYFNVIVPNSVIVNQTHLFFIATTKSLSTIVASDRGVEVYPFAIGKQTTEDCTNIVTPYRAEVYSVGGLTVMLAIYIASVVVLLALTISGAQPLHSRGISPYYVVFFLFTQLLSEVRNYYYPTYSQASLCLFYAYLYYPALQSCYIIILFYYIRYFLIISMNELKNSVGSQEDAMDIVRKRVLLIKLFLSKWTIIIYVLASYILVNIIFTIVLASNKYVCSFNILLILKLVYSIELIVVYFVIMAAVAFDMGMNWKKLIRCKWIDYIFYSDPFWFRAQVMIFLVYLIYQFVTDIVMITKTSTYIDNLSSYYLISVLNTVSSTFLFAIDVVYPIIITIIYYCIQYYKLRVSCKPNNFVFKLEQRVIEKDRGILTTLLNDEKGYRLIEEFCRNEFSIENIVCWRDIEAFKKDPTMIRAKQVYVTYLQGAASFLEVNIPLTQCHKIGILIENEEIHVEMFKEIEQGITANLSDTFNRFQFTNTYYTYLLMIQTQRELLEMDTPVSRKTQTQKPTIVSVESLPEPEPIRSVPIETHVEPPVIVSTQQEPLLNLELPIVEPQEDSLSQQVDEVVVKSNENMTPQANIEESIEPH